MSFDLPSNGGDTPDSPTTDVSYTEEADGTATFKLGDKSLGDQSNRINALPSTPALSDAHEQSRYSTNRVKRMINFSLGEIKDQIQGVIENVSGSTVAFERALHDMSDPSFNTPDSFIKMVSRAVVFLLLSNQPDEIAGREEVANTLELVIQSALQTNGVSLANLLDENSLRTGNPLGK